MAVRHLPCRKPARARTAVQWRQLRVLDEPNLRSAHSSIRSARIRRVVIVHAYGHRHGNRHRIERTWSDAWSLDDARQTMTRAARAASVLIAAIVLSAHVGSPNVIFDGRAG